MGEFKIYQRFNTDTQASGNMRQARMPDPQPHRARQPLQSHAQPSQTQPQAQRQAQSSQPQAQRQAQPSQPQPQHRAQQPKAHVIQNQAVHNQQKNTPKRHIRRKTQHKNNQASGIGGFISRILPPSVYNPETKKLFGVLAAEDLLLVALIFLFLDSDDEDSNLLVLALAFVLLSDYIDLSSFAF